MRISGPVELAELLAQAGVSTAFVAGDRLDYDRFAEQVDLVAKVAKPVWHDWPDDCDSEAPGDSDCEI